MRTAKYEQAFQEVRLYCSYASDCIILAEINDLNTADEFIQDISAYFPVEVYSLSSLAETSKSANFAIEKFSSKIIIINEILSGDNKSIVGNLNYNRDWLMSFNERIIIVLPTVIVDQVRSSSYNFWSCVSLQRAFDTDKPCMMSPVFIDDMSMNMESNEDINRRKSINKKLYKAQQSVRGIISKAFAISSHEISIKELKELLNKQISQIDPTDTRQVIEFFDFAFDLGLELYFCGHFRYALECFQFIKKKLNFGYNYQSLRIKLQETIAQTYYKMHRYEDAADEYAMLINFYSQTKKAEVDRFWNTKQIMRICNNFATSIYFLKNYNEALLWFQFSAEFAGKTLGYLHYSQVLYNLALLSHIVGKSIEAIEYIDTAIQIIESLSSRHYNIITANYKVLRAYILLNEGALLDAKDDVRASLSLLRKELYESSFYILTAHFVYASVYLRSKRMSEALHCATKAVSISKDVQCSSAVKAQLYELIGEIYYYLGDFDQARQNLSIALLWDKRSQVFPLEIKNWMYDQVNRN